MSPRFCVVFVALISLFAGPGATDSLAAGGFFRSRATSRRPSYQQPSTNSRESRRDSRRDTSETAKPHAASNPYPGVDPPPAAPRAVGVASSRSNGMGAVSTRPTDTIKYVNAAIDRTKRRYLTVGEHTPWQIFHGVLALRHEFQLRQGNQLVRGLDWLRDGVIHDGFSLVEKTEHGGRCHPFTVPWAFEGHTNQFLAILSIASLPDEYQFRTSKGEIVSMADMVNHAQMTMDGKGEMTWTLWFLTHYVEPDAEWENAFGQFWSMERLVRMEARHKINGAPCGGTHRLFALSLARNAYLKKHGRVNGAWLEADQKVQQFVASVRSLQNRDGSFSSDWFKGRGYSTDLTTRLKTSGHTLEWLMVALPDNQLRDRWVQMAVQSVARDVIRSATEPAECGALYHALDALTFYKLRMDPPKTSPAQSPTLLVPESTPPATMARKDPEPKPLTMPEEAKPTDTVPNVTVPTAPIVSVKPPKTAAMTEPGAPSTFVAPITVKPIPKPTDIPRTAAAPTETLRPLASDARDETKVDTADTKPITPSLAGDDSLVVEQVTPQISTPGPLSIPSDVQPLKTVLPDKPDAESSPHVVESAEPSPDAEEQPAPTTDDAMADEAVIVEKMNSENASIEEPTEAAPKAEPASDKPVEVAETKDAQTASVEQPMADEPAEAPSETTPAEAKPVEKTAAEPSDAPQSVSVAPSLPTLKAPSRPGATTPQVKLPTVIPTAAPGKKRVAEEPQSDTKTTMTRGPIRNGLIVIQLDDIASQPIKVPMAGQSSIQRTSWR